MHSVGHAVAKRLYAKGLRSIARGPHVHALSAKRCTAHVSTGIGLIHQGTLRKVSALRE
jgi:hypothetical protein